MVEAGLTKIVSVKVKSVNTVSAGASALAVFAVRKIGADLAEAVCIAEVPDFALFAFLEAVFAGEAEGHPLVAGQAFAVFGPEVGQAASASLPIRAFNAVIEDS